MTSIPRLSLSVHTAALFERYLVTAMGNSPW